MGYNYRDVVTGRVYAPSPEAPAEYFQEWARFEPTDDPVTPLENTVGEVIVNAPDAPAADAPTEAPAAEAPAETGASVRKGGKGGGE